MQFMARVLAVILLSVLCVIDARAENLVPQGRFDDPSSVESWLLNYGPGSFEFAPGGDHQYCPSSGGMLLRNTSSVLHGTYSVWQCLGLIAPEQQIEAGISVLFPANQPGTELHFVIAYFGSSDCSGNIWANPNVGFNNYLPFGWRSASFPATPPPGAQSVELVLYFINSNFSHPIEVLIDDLYLRSSTDIFSDDFEQGTRCRWSTSTWSGDN